jgi:hypothetical protein
LTGLGFSISLCPNHLGNCYNWRQIPRFYYSTFVLIVGTENLTALYWFINSGTWFDYPAMTSLVENW